MCMSMVTRRRRRLGLRASARVKRAQTVLAVWIWLNICIRKQTYAQAHYAAYILHIIYRYIVYSDRICVPVCCDRGGVGVVRVAVLCAPHTGNVQYAERTGCWLLCLAL